MSSAISQASFHASASRHFKEDDEWESEVDTGERVRWIRVRDGGDDEWTMGVDAGVGWRWMQVHVPCRDGRGVETVLLSSLKDCFKLVKMYASAASKQM